MSIFLADGVLVKAKVKSPSPALPLMHVAEMLAPFRISRSGISRRCADERHTEFSIKHRPIGIRRTRTSLRLRG